MSKPHLVMPMGGAGSRFYKNGYMQPKPLIEIHGKPFLYWSTMSIMKYIDVEDLTFVVLEQHIKEFQIDRVIYSFFQDAKIKVISEVLPGPVFTALHGIEDIDDSAPVIFNDCDHMFKCSEMVTAFKEGFTDIDGALLTFISNEPQFSYVQYDKDNSVVGTLEKQVISDHAICGAYIFSNVGLFKQMAEIYIKDCPYNECFMSGIYNEMCKKGLKVKDYLLDYHVEFGTPEEYKEAEKSDWFDKI